MWTWSFVGNTPIEQWRSENRLNFKIYIMGRQRDSKLVCTIGNLIFYNRLGEYCIRTKPVDVKRTRASIHSGFNFGKASRIGRQIRNLIGPINQSKSDSLTINRLNGAINKFISWKEKKDAASVTMPKKLPFIYGFQFNDQADLTSIIAIKVSIKSSEPGLIEISLDSFIPSRALHAPANTNRILFKMILLDTNLKDAETHLLGKTEIEIPYSSEPFQPPVISLQACAKPGDLIMMVMSVQYLVNKNGDVELLNDKKKLPCGVVWTGCLAKVVS